ncbi:class I SAM-dependent methyltransferase [Flavivirga jejuensis]|uniref:Class I SAM-dependent methyltransferase n=1 Tax=Flavivirga jejuensis TaxID=870487 RepID=A0ABT8WK70_9FLAO|nr:class I SAM-dependent methyltransferase [Flavivirga jejuensis]MDO5973558.1 class I SAM-dependent methyltransferase [Flavivirga jejuensis]
MSNLSFSNFFLKNPFIYWTYQRLVGGDRARRLFVENNVQPIEGEKILDIGCGPGNILDYMPKVDYYGFDIDPNYIEAAKQNYGERGQFICANMDEFIVPDIGTFDKVIATGVIHHLDDSNATKLFKIAEQALKPSGCLITFDGCYIANQNFISQFLLKSDRGKYVRKQPEYEKLAQKFFSQVNATIDETYFRVPYTSIMMDCKKVAN